MRIPEQRESLYDRAMKSLDLTPKTKAEFERCRDYRKKQETLKLLKGEGKKKGHDEGLFWKCHATAELVAKMENVKYVLHQPFNRQIKKMAQDGFPMAAATMDDWHQAACGMIEPLYELQKKRVFSCMLLAGDGSPFPIINSEKHKYGGTLPDSVSLGGNRNPRLPRQHP